MATGLGRPPGVQSPNEEVKGIINALSVNECHGVSSV